MQGLVSSDHQCPAALTITPNHFHLFGLFTAKKTSDEVMEIAFGTIFKCSRKQVIREYEVPFPLLECRPPLQPDDFYHPFLPPGPNLPDYIAYNSVLIRTENRKEEGSIHTSEESGQPVDTNATNLVIKMKKPWTSRPILTMIVNGKPRLYNKFASFHRVVNEPLRRLTPQPDDESNEADQGQFKCHYFSAWLYSSNYRPRHRGAWRIVLYNDSADIYEQLCQRIFHCSISDMMHLNGLPLTLPLLEALFRLWEQNGVTGTQNFIIHNCSLHPDLGARPSLLRLLNRIFLNVDRLAFTRNHGLTARRECAEFLDSLLTTRAMLGASRVYLELEECYSNAHFATDALIHYILGIDVPATARSRPRLELTVDWCPLDLDFIEKLLKRFLQAVNEQVPLRPFQSTLLRLPQLFQTPPSVHIPQFDFASLSSAVSEATNYKKHTTAFSLHQIDDNTTFQHGCDGNRHPPRMSDLESGCKQHMVSYPCSKTTYELRPSTCDGLSYGKADTNHEGLSLRIEVILFQRTADEVAHGGDGYGGVSRIYH